MLNKLKKIYQIIPVSFSSRIIRFFKLNPYFSSKTWEAVSFIEKNYNNHKILEENLKQLYETIKKIPYYSYIRKKDLEIKNLKKMKFMNSEILRENFDNILNKSIKGYYSSTGGTGRKPSKIFLSDLSYLEDISHVIWGWEKLGYKNGSKKLTLRGVNLGKELYKYNPIYNELQINIFLMNQENIDKILREVEKFNPDFGHGYPSAFVKFCKLVENKNFKFNLLGISLASESFNETQREIIERTFKCRARGFFAHSERACFAIEMNECPGIYKIAMTYGLIEIINEKGKNCDLNEEGEIVCTGFINKGMPLIRYKTGDYATVNKLDKGIVVEIRGIKGRWGKDFVYDLFKNPIPTTAINIHSKLQYEFKYIQLLQKEYGVIILKLVPWNRERIENYMIEKIVEEFSNKIPHIKVIGEIVKENEIYKTHRGKVPYLLSDIIAD